MHCSLNHKVNRGIILILSLKVTSLRRNGQQTQDEQAYTDISHVDNLNIINALRTSATLTKTAKNDFSD